MDTCHQMGCAGYLPHRDRIGGVAVQRCAGAAGGRGHYRLYFEPGG